MLTIREIKKAATLEEAWQLNQKRPNRVMGGMLWMRLSKGNVATMIDLSALGLDKIEEGETEFSIGAMVTLRQLELHAGLAAYTQGAMKEALRHIVGVQFRNLATVGGSVFGRFGFSDVLTIFMALDAKVEMFNSRYRKIAEQQGLEWEDFLDQSFKYDTEEYDEQIRLYAESMVKTERIVYAAASQPFSSI